MRDILLEVCVDSPCGLAAAIEGGADRIELCSALCAGGLTPSAGLVAAAAGAPVPVYAMIRPRAGDFAYSQAELEVMARDIEAARDAGLAGVVFGAVGRDGRLDQSALRLLVARAAGLGTTLHRAFDLVSERAQAIETAVALGFERILTSGGAPTALQGLDTLQETVALAGGRIAIMPGAGIRPETVDTLLARLPVGEIHASCSVAEASPDPRLAALGFQPKADRRTDAGLVRALKRRLMAA